MKTSKLINCSKQAALGLLGLALVTGLQAATTWQWDGGAGNDDWTSPNNWNPNASNTQTNGSFDSRLNVNGAQKLVYRAAQGATVYARATDRGLVIGSGAAGSGTMEIIGGSFSTLGSSALDVIGNNAGNTGTLIINGGTFIGAAAGTGLGIGGGPTSILTITNGGIATVTLLTNNNTSGTVNLDGGTLSANKIVRGSGTATFNFNGGTLKPRVSRTDFLTGWSRANVRNGGALMDTDGYDITIGQALLHSNVGGDNTTDGGLTKNGSGILTLSGTSTYNGGTVITAGTLALGNATDTLLDSGAINVNGGTLDIAANSDTVGAVTLASGSITGSGGTLTGSAYGVQSGTVSAILGGAGVVLTKTTAATVTLSGANTYTGNTVVSAGTLALDSTGALAANSSVELAAGATFDVSAIGFYTWGASASLIATGSGTTSGTDAAELVGTTDLGSQPVTLNFTPASFAGDSTHPALYVSSGSLTLNSPITINNLGASPLGNGTYVLIAQASGTITGSPFRSGLVGGSGIEAGKVANVQVNGSNVELVVQDALATTTDLYRTNSTPSSNTYGDALAFGVSVTPAAATGTVELWDGGLGGTLIGTGTLSGGVCTITPAETALDVGSHTNLVARYLGDTTYGVSSSAALSPAQSVSAKALTVTGAVAQNKFYDGTTAAIISGGSLTVGGGPGEVEIGDTVTLSQSGTFASVGPGAGISVACNSTLGGADASNYTVTEPTGLSAEIYASPVWTGAAADTLWDTGGNWAGGIAAFGANVTADFSTLDITTDQTVNLNSPRTIGSLTFGDTDTGSAGGWTLANNGTAANTLRLEGSAPTVTVNALGGSASVTVSAVVAGTNGLTKAGTGTLVLSGANTYSGGTTVTNTGTLIVSSATGLGTGAATVVSGASLQLNSTLTGSSTSFTNTFFGLGRLTVLLSTDSPANTTLPGVAGFSGSIVLTNDGSTGDKFNISVPTVSSATLEIQNGNTIYLTTNVSFSSITLLGTGNTENRGAIRLGTAGASLSGNLSLLGDTALGSDSAAATIAGNISGTATTGGTNVLTQGSLSAAGCIISGIISDGPNGGQVALVQKNGTLTLTGPNTYTGPTTVSAATLLVNGNQSAATGAVTVFSGATLGGAGSIGGAVTLQNGARLAPGSGGVGILTNTALTLSAGSTANFEITDATTLDQVIVTTSGGLTLNGVGFNLYQPGTTTAFTANGTYTLFQYSGTLNGSLGSLSVLNAQPGKTYLFSADGANVQLTIADGPTPIYWGSDADGSWGTALSWSPATVPNAQFATASFGGPGSPAFSTAHTVTLDGTYTLGALVFDTAQSFAINEGSGGGLQFDNGAALALVTETSGSHSVNVPVTLPGAGAAVSAVTNTTLALNGPVSGSGGITKSAPGTLVLGGTNTYAGITTISQGIVSVTANQALGTTAGGTILNGGDTTALQLANGVVVSGETVEVKGYGVAAPTVARGALQAAASATAEWAGPVLLGSGDSRIGAQANGSLELSGVIANGAGSTLTASADPTGGKVIVSGTANTYTGPSQVLRGTLEIGANNALPITTVLNVDSASGTGDNGTFEMNGYNQEVAGIVRGYTGGTFSIKNSSVSPSTLTVNNTNADYTFPNTASGATTIEGNLALIKTGSRRLTLDRPNTFTGNTTINAGTLALTGSGTISGTPLITVGGSAVLDVAGVSGGFVLGSGQTLQGAGTVVGNVTADGTLAAGTSIGTLSFSTNLTINGNLVFELDKSLAQSNDLIQVSGTLANTGVGTLTVTNIGTPALAVNDSFRLFSQPVANGLALTIVGPDGVTFTNKLEEDGSIAVLTVPQTIPSEGTNLTYQVGVGQIILSWPTNYKGWYLQTQTNLLSKGLSSTNWVTIPGSESVTSTNLPLTKTDPTVFFRMVHTNTP
jgi:autotransporter-associated beta strand protein